MNVSRSTLYLCGLLGFLLLVCGKSGVRTLAQAMAGTIQLQGKVVVADGSILAVMTDSDSRNFPDKLYKVIFNSNTKALEIDATDRRFKPISISDIREGDHVMMLGRLANLTATDFMATSVTRTASAGGKVADASSSSATTGVVPQNAPSTGLAQAKLSVRPDTTLAGYVLSISGNLISVKNKFGTTTFTVSTGAQTRQIPQGCGSVDCAIRMELAELSVGDIIWASCLRNPSNTLNAIELLRKVKFGTKTDGTVKAVSGNLVTITTGFGQTIRVTVDRGSEIFEQEFRGPKTAGSLNDISVGDMIHTTGNAGALPDTVSATSVQISKAFVPSSADANSATPSPNSRVSKSDSNQVPPPKVNTGPSIAEVGVHQMQGTNDPAPYHWQIVESTDPLTHEKTMGLRERIRISPTHEFLLVMGCKEDLGMALQVKSFGQQLSQSCRKSRLLAETSPQPRSPSAQSPTTDQSTGERLFEGEKLDCTREENNSIVFSFIGGGSFSHANHIQAQQTTEMIKAATPAGPDKEKQDAISDVVGMFMEVLGGSIAQGMPKAMGVLGMPLTSDLIEADTFKVEVPFADGSAQVLSFSPQDPVIRAYTATCVGAGR